MVADPDPPTPETQADDEENPGISAGYTYLGQFIDHDLTFDPASSLQRQDDPDGLHLLTGAELHGNLSDTGACDLPRNTPARGELARALIGDPRNDENVIVSQLQSAMIRFHNRVVDFLIGRDGSTMFGQDTWSAILPHAAGNTDSISDPPQLCFYRPQREGYIPIEFSAAAYRFGHSMVRPIYRINETADRLPIFSTSGPSLAGFNTLRSDLAIDWRLFFKMNGAPALGPQRVQPAYKIDTSIMNPLGTLPASVAGDDPHSLAARNLLRGLRMGLPSGQDVARTMGFEPLADDELRIDKATAADFSNNPSITAAGDFAGNAPLWFYVLAEAQQQFRDDTTPIHLGPVGGRIVGEVMVGLMLADSHSYLRQQPRWKPLAELCTDGRFQMADLLGWATAPAA
jgi:hypothetical protein